MGRSLHLGTYFGIPVKVHWTFGLIIFMLVYLIVMYQLSLAESLWFISYIGSLFLCVILHEYGHALSARRYHVNTRDIIISPIGGLARLESIPKQPLQEFVIAIAGPLVNLVLASLLFLMTIFVLGKPPSFLMDGFDLAQNVPEFVRTLFMMNVVLFLFNLIPAFPMDGGRILRSLLAVKMGNYRSTVISTLIGKGFAIAFLIYGIGYSHYAIIFIAFFVFYMAHQEYRQVALDHALQTKHISEIANKDFTKLFFSDPMSKAYDAQQDGQSSFLVFDYDDMPIASLPALFIADAKKEDSNTDRNVVDFVSTKVTLLDEDTSILAARTLMQEQGLSIVGVVAGEHLLGVIDREGIMNFMKAI